MVNQLLIDIVCVLIFLFIGNALFLYLFIQRYTEEIKMIYEKMDGININKENK